MEGTDTGPSEKNLEEVMHLTARKTHITAELDLMRGQIFKQDEWIKNLKKEVDARDAQQKKNEIALAEIMLYLHTTDKSVEKAKARKIVRAFYTVSHLPLVYLSFNYILRFEH